MTNGTLRLIAADGLTTWRPFYFLQNIMHHQVMHRAQSCSPVSLRHASKRLYSTYSVASEDQPRTESRGQISITHGRAPTTISIRRLQAARDPSMVRIG